MNQGKILQHMVLSFDLPILKNNYSRSVTLFSRKQIETFFKDVETIGYSKTYPIYSCVSFSLIIILTMTKEIQKNVISCLRVESEPSRSLISVD